MELSKEALEYANNLAIIAKELTSKGLSMDEAINIAPDEYKKRQSNFYAMLQDDAFKTAYVNGLRKYCNLNNKK